MCARNSFRNGCECAHRLAYTLFRRDFPECREYNCISSDSMARTNLLTRAVVRRRLGDTHFDDIDCRCRMGFPNLLREPIVMDEDGPAGFDDDAQHGPQIGQRSEQTGGSELGEIGARIGMVELELATVVVPSWMPLLQQHASARVV